MSAAQPGRQDLADYYDIGNSNTFLCFVSLSPNATIRSHRWSRASWPYAIDMPCSLGIQDQAHRQQGGAYAYRPRRRHPASLPRFPAQHGPQVRHHEPPPCEGVRGSFLGPVQVHPWHYEDRHMGKLPELHRCSVSLHDTVASGPHRKGLHLGSREE